MPCAYAPVRCHRRMNRKRDIQRPAGCSVRNGRCAMALIDVHHLTKQFIVRTGWLGRPRTVLTAVHDVSLTIHSGRPSAWSGNRAAANRPLPVRSWACTKNIGHGPVQGKGCRKPRYGRCISPPGADDIPGPVRLAGSPHDRRRYHRRTSAQLWHLFVPKPACASV